MNLLFYFILFFLVFSLENKSPDQFQVLLLGQQRRRVWPENLHEWMETKVNVDWDLEELSVEEQDLTISSNFSRAKDFCPEESSFGPPDAAGACSACLGSVRRGAGRRLAGA